MRRPEIVFGRQSEKKMCRGQGLKTGLTLAVTIFFRPIFEIFSMYSFQQRVQFKYMIKGPPFASLQGFKRPKYHNFLYTYYWFFLDRVVSLCSKKEQNKLPRQTTFGVIHVEMNAYLSCVLKIFFKKLKIYLLKKFLGYLYLTLHSLYALIQATGDTDALKNWENRLDMILLTF